MYQNAYRSLRVVGVEDGGFRKGFLKQDSERALFVATLLCGMWIEDIAVEEITVDGLDATEKLLGMIRPWTFDAIILAGISFGGFNLVDPTIVSRKFNKPVIVVSRTKPNNVAVKRALLRHFKDWRVRWSIFEKLGAVYELVSMPSQPPVYIEISGVDMEWASRLIRASALCCRVPEPLRVARIIARGLTPKI